MVATVSKNKQKNSYLQNINKLLADFFIIREDAIWKLQLKIYQDLDFQWKKISSLLSSSRACSY